MLKDDLTQKYGPTMSIDDVAEVFHIKKGTIYNRICVDKFEIPMVKIGGRLVAITGDVVDFLEHEKLFKN